MKRILEGLGIVLLAAGVTLVVLGKGKELALLNPLSGIQKSVEKEKKMVVLGFLPTWMVGKTQIYGSEVDELVFLGVGVSKDGSLVWETQSKKLNNDDFIKQKENISKTGGKNILGIKLFDDKSIDALLASDEAKKKLFTEVRDVLVAGNFAGVNIDFEYMSNPTRVLDDDFGIFLDGVKQAGWGEVSIDVFTNTIIKGNSEGLKKMMEKVDRVVVMAYDFHRPGSDYAGAVAAMKANVGERSVSEILQTVVDFGLNKEQIIMAYPLYGYEWETETNLLNSATRTGGYGSTVFYKDGIGFTGTTWEETAQSPWVAWQEKAQRSKIVTKKVGKKYKKVTEYYTVDQWHQAYFENEESLKIKVEAAKQAQVGGVGFWALGYEGTESALISNLKSQITN
jgi:spore germination protein YaaH